MKDPDLLGLVIPPDNPLPPEPPIGTVVSFHVRHRPGTNPYSYAAIRAGDGKWYTTGRGTAQGVDWSTFANAVRERLAGPLMVMRVDRLFHL